MIRLAAKRLLGVEAVQIRAASEIVTRRRYHENVIEHFNNPRNVGSFDKNDPNVGTGLVGAPACGDVMKLQIKVDEKTGEIVDARFKTFGCGSAIASSSVASEWVKGKHMEEVLSIKNTIHKFLETKKKNDTKEQKPENESDALTAEAVKRTPRKQLEHVFEIPLPEEPDTEDEAEIQKWKWKVNSVNQPVRRTTLLGFPVVQPYHHFGRHLFVGVVQPFRAIQEVVGPLQVRYFQHDFVPSNPKSKPKRYKYPEFYDPYGPRPHPSEKIVQLAEQIAALSPDERAQIGPTLRYKLKHPKLQLISTEGRDLGSQGGAAAAGGVAAKVEEKKEKMAFDVKLEKFEAAAKIKVIKEVRAFTNLGLKEAKDLVEKVPVLLKQGVTKEEANDIIEKIKIAGGVAVIE